MDIVESKLSPARYATYSQKDLADYASGFRDTWSGDPVAGLPADHYHWTYYPTYEVSNFLREIHNYNEDQWKQWMHDEVLMHAEDGRPEHYSNLMDCSPIQEPVVAVQFKDTMTIWDGYHRVGSSFVCGRRTLPAVIGVAKQSMKFFEVADEGSFPIQDHIAVPAMQKSFLRSQPVQPLFSAHGIDVMIPRFRDDFYTLFMMDGENVIGEVHIDQAGDYTRIPYIYIIPEYRLMGLGYGVYEYFLNNGHIVQSGKTHTEDSKALWVKLAREHVVTHNGVRHTESLPYGDRKRFLARLDDSE